MQRHLTNAVEKGKPKTGSNGWTSALKKISGRERVESNEFGIYYVNQTPRPVRTSMCPPLYHFGIFVFSWCSIASIETNASGSTSHGITRSSASVDAGQSLPIRINPLLVRAAPKHDHKLRWELFRLPELDCYVNVIKTFVQTGTGDDRDEFRQTRLLRTSGRIRIDPLKLISHSVVHLNMELTSSLSILVNHLFLSVSFHYYRASIGYTHWGNTMQRI
jgi:hypothetical protein